MKKIRINVYLTEDLKNTIRLESEKLSLSMNSFILIAVNHYLKNNLK